MLTGAWLHTAAYSERLAAMQGWQHYYKQIHKCWLIQVRLNSNFSQFLYNRDTFSRLPPYNMEQFFLLGISDICQHLGLSKCNRFERSRCNKL